MSSAQRPPLQPRCPVPSDIEVSQSVQPVNIAEIAAESGVLPEELELYGNNKAKVSGAPMARASAWPFFGFAAECCAIAFGVALRPNLACGCR